MENSANAARAITLGSDITLGEIDLKGTVGTSQTLFFGDTTEDNTLNFGGAATITTNDYYVTDVPGVIISSHRLSIAFSYFRAFSSHLKSGEFDIDPLCSLVGVKA